MHARHREPVTGNENDWQFHRITVACFEPIDDIEAKSEKYHENFLARQST